MPRFSIKLAIIWRFLFPYLILNFFSFLFFWRKVVLLNETFGTLPRTTLNGQSFYLSYPFLIHNPCNYRLLYLYVKRQLERTRVTFFKSPATIVGDVVAGVLTVGIYETILTSKIKKNIVRFCISIIGRLSTMGYE